MTTWETVGLNVMLNTGWQSLIVGIAGVVILRLMCAGSVSARALTALGVMAALALLPLINWNWQKYDADWRTVSVAVMRQLPTAAPSTPAVKIPQAVVPAEKPRPEVSATAASPSGATQPKPAATAGKKYADKVAVVLAGIWLAGLLVMLVRLFYGLIFLQGYRFGLKPVSDAKLEAALVRASVLLPLKKLPPVYVSSAVTSPLTVGIFRPAMILPENLLGQLNENEILSIVLHEFSHVWHRDHLTGLFKRLVTAAYWWNPAVYRLDRVHADAAEELSDNCALRQLKPEDYSECLLQLAEKTGMISRLPATIGMAVRPGGLKRRVLGLLAHDRKLTLRATGREKLWATGLAVLVIGIAGGCGLCWVQNPPANTTKTMTHWEKYQIWDVMRKGGNDFVTANPEREQQLLRELTQNIWVVRFKPVNGFMPYTPRELIREFDTSCRLESSTESIGGASVFRTKPENGVLVGSFLTETPDAMKKALSQSKKLQLLSCQPMTPEQFTVYVNSPQEHLPVPSALAARYPKVVKTVPANGETVDAGKVREVSVTFSKDMNTSGSWSFCTDGSGEMPRTVGTPHWTDKRTCTMAVKLEPGRNYVLWFNHDRFDNFRDPDGYSSIPYKLAFKTTDGEETTVVDTFPKLNATVDPKTVKEVRVTFSQDMNTSGGWSFCSNGEHFFPNNSGMPHWLDKRTCAMPVKLIAGRTYMVVFNAGRFIGFRDAKRRPSKSYRLLFKTSGLSGETASENKPKVCETSPRHSEIVDADQVKEIRVTFSEDMNTDCGWSIVPEDGHRDVWRQALLKTHWQGKRTCIIPIKLEPNQSYVVWFNLGRSYCNFVNVKGNSAIPYLLCFSTADKNAKKADPAPTVVISTVPRNGETVNADQVKEIRVTFSADMTRNHPDYAFHFDNENFYPYNFNIEMRWEGTRTLVTPVLLLPGRTYSIGFNPGHKFGAFTDAHGRQSVAYHLVFKTAGTSAETSDEQKPKVVATFPREGAVVDAVQVKEIRVTFSEDMLNRDGAWSIYFGDNYFPQPTDAPIHWQDVRTWVYPVKLEPHKAYSLWVNKGKSLRNFVNAKGNSAVPYQLNFTTK